MGIQACSSMYGHNYPQRDTCPTRAFTMACLNPSHQCTWISLYNKQGQVRDYLDVLCASLGLIIFPMSIAC
jgi:hypothetical protein